LVYSCLTTRAVHLELVEDLTTNGTLNALQNVINIRGAPKRITSDQGTNFIGANNEMLKVVAEYNSKLIKQGIIITPIEWYFNPAKAPHMQGAVEIMVGMTKTIIRKLELMKETDQKSITDFGFRNMLTQITNMLNNRPLVMKPIGDGTEFLTPNHFIMLKMNQQFIPDDSNKKVILKTWKDIQQYMSTIWKSFVELYLPTLRDRKKWKLRTAPLKIGDIVLTVENNIQDDWRIGKVIAAEAGSNEQTRKLTIRLGKTNTIPANMLRDKTKLIKVYKDEKYVILERPAHACAKIYI
jgi:hypothetical protein